MMTDQPISSFSSAQALRPRGILQLMKAYFSTNRIGDLLLLEGLINEDQLQGALQLARTRHHRIGQVLVDEHFIRRHELYATLGKQWGIRSLAWGVAVFMSIGSFGPRQVRAEDRSGTPYETSQSYEVASSMGLGVTRDDLKPIHSYPALFGSTEKRSSDLSAFTKWTSMFDRYEGQMNATSNKPILASWRRELGRTNERTLVETVRQVDRMVNEVEYVEDRDNYNKSDYWATPIEFFKRGGDCEDFAIAKYMSLKALGVPEERLRIAIVHDMIKNIPHAILIVYTDDGAMVLDNQSKVTRWAEDITRYKPIFSINKTGWWLHTKGANMQVASAAR